MSPTAPRELNTVHSRMGTTVARVRRPATTSSWTRATRSTHSSRSRLTFSASSPYRSAGTGLMTAATSPVSTLSTGPRPATAPEGTTPARTIP